MIEKWRELTEQDGTFGALLKLDSQLLNKIIFVCFNESPLKMMENAFYFIIKALFVLKVFKCFS